MLVVLLVCTAFLMLGYLNKARCLNGQFNARAFHDHCYNDLQPLFGLRTYFDIDGDQVSEHVFPYVDGYRDTVDDQGNPISELRDGAIEYPVLTGLFMWASSLPVDNADSWLRLSALLLAPFGLLAAFLLARMAGWRALMWAAAPALVFYSFHNWDLLVVAAVVAGIWFWSRGSPIWAAVLFGVGAAFKMYPIFFLAPLFLDRFTAGDKRGAFGSAIAGSGTFTLINLPFMIINWDGWIATYTFHSHRGPNFDTMWCAMKDLCLSAPGWDPSSLNRITLGLTALFFVAILAVGLLRFRSEGVYPFVQTCGALLATFLLWNKVHSPQYTLWLLPFFVLIGHWIPALVGWSAYALADAYVYWGIFRWFTDYASEDLPMSEKVMLVGIWMRALLLLAFVVYFMLAKRAHPPRPPNLAGDRSPRVDPSPVLTGSASA